MGIVNRFFLFLLSAGSLALSICMLGIYFGLIPQMMWVNEIIFASQQLATPFVSVLVIVISINLMALAFSRVGDPSDSRGEILLQSGEQGYVSVSADAVRTFVEDAARNMRDVIDAQAKIRTDKKDATLDRVTLRLIVGTRANIPSLSAALGERLQERLEQSLGVPSIPIEVSVAGISDKVVNRRQRVV